jgi:hypothetical protein
MRGITAHGRRIPRHWRDRAGDRDHAEQVYGSLHGAGRDAVRRMLPRLVRVGEDASDTARSVERAELLHGLADPGAAQRAIDRCAAARLLTLDRDTVRISHEALLREWPDLRKWINAGP